MWSCPVFQLTWRVQSECDLFSFWVKQVEVLLVVKRVRVPTHCLCLRHCYWQSSGWCEESIEGTPTGELTNQQQGSRSWNWRICRRNDLLLLLHLTSGKFCAILHCFLLTDCFIVFRTVGIDHCLQAQVSIFKWWSVFQRMVTVHWPLPVKVPSAWIWVHITKPDVKSLTQCRLVCEAFVVISDPLTCTISWNLL